MSFSDIIVRVTDQDGPLPLAEIDALIEQCRTGTKGRGKFGARKSGRGWARRPPGGATQYVVVFHLGADGVLEGCVADIVDKWPAGHRPKALPEVYAAWADHMESWWIFRNATRFTSGKHLRDIPGHSTLRRPADLAFGGAANQVMFAGWEFAFDPRRMLCAAEL